MGRFETSEAHSNANHRPVQVPILKQDVFGMAREMCEDLDGWSVREVDAEGLKILCERKGGLMGGTASITIRVDGPEGIPSSTTSVTSESTGGVMSKDKAIVSEFVKKFRMRIC